MILLREEIARLAEVADRRGNPRVTLIRSGALGDTILLLPTVQCIRGALPRAQITLVGSSWALQLMPLMEQPWDFFPFESPAITPLFGNACHPPTCLAASRADPLVGADMVVAYTSDPEGPFVRNLRTLCPCPVIAWPVEPPPGVHAACHLAAAMAVETPREDALPAAGLRALGPTRDRARQWLRDGVGRAGARVALIHPGSGSPRKCWPAEGFAEVIRRLARDGWRTALLEGPADRQACEAVSALAPADRLPAARTEDIAQAAGLIAAADVFVGNDSGAAHLSAALGTPTVAVFGPTDPAMWRPLGRAVRVARGQASPGASAWPSPDEVLSAVRAVTADC
jgi:hypothetical protein